MQVIDPGHLYQLPHLDGWGKSFLRFVKREGLGYPGNVGHYEGVNLQEVWRASIDRLRYLDNQIPHPGNKVAIFHLQNAILELEMRAAERHGHPLVDVYAVGVELHPTCPVCGHIQCHQYSNP